MANLEHLTEDNENNDELTNKLPMDVNDMLFDVSELPDGLCEDGGDLFKDFSNWPTGAGDISMEELEFVFRSQQANPSAPSHVGEKGSPENNMAQVAPNVKDRRFQVLESSPFRLPPLAPKEPKDVEIVVEYTNVPGGRNSWKKGKNYKCGKCRAHGFICYKQNHICPYTKDKKSNPQSG